MGLVEAVAQEGGSVSATTVATRSGLSFSTTSRLLRELTEAGLLERNPSTGTYGLGTRLLAVTRSGGEQSDLLRSALPVMEELRDETGETVSLHVAAVDRRVCIAEVQSRHAVRRVVPLGLALPLHRGATGAVIFATMAPNRQAEYLASPGLLGQERSDLERDTKVFKTHGWLLAADSWEPGLAGIAAPVRRGDTAVAVLTVSGPSSRWTPSVMKLSAPRLLSAAMSISIRL